MTTMRGTKATPAEVEAMIEDHRKEMQAEAEIERRRQGLINHNPLWQSGGETRESPACADNRHAECEYTAAECDCRHYGERNQT